MFPEKTEASAGIAHIFLNTVIFYVFISEVAIAVPLFSCFVIFGMYQFVFRTLPFQTWGFF